MLITLGLVAVAQIIVLVVFGFCDPEPRGVGRIVAGAALLRDCNCRAAPRNVALLFTCASLPLFLGGEVEGGSRTVRRTLRDLGVGGGGAPDLCRHRTEPVRPIPDRAPRDARLHRRRDRLRPSSGRHRARARRRQHRRGDRGRVRGPHARRPRGHRHRPAARGAWASAPCSCSAPRWHCPIPTRSTTMR